MYTLKKMTAIVVLATVSSVVGVAAAHNHGKTEQAKSAAAEDAEMTNAEIRKIDKDAKKITLKHEAIKSLDMPGMTMVFQVKDATLLDKAQVGEKVKVKIIQEGKAYVVTEIQAAN
jgi:Cu(I)/Ag(I) efflux system periplasmic protein CusF